MVESNKAVSTQRFGPIHCGIGIADQIAGLDAIIRIDDQTNACGQNQIPTIDLKWPAKCLCDPIGNDFGIITPTVTVQQYEELIATGASDRIPMTHQPFETLSGVNQDAVAHIVAKRFIYLLEVIEVQNQHGQSTAFFFDSSQRTLQTLGQKYPVGQMRQSIVMGLSIETVFGLLPLRDVLQIPFEHRLGTVLEGWFCMHSHPDRIEAVRTYQATFKLQGCLCSSG